MKTRLLIVTFASLSILLPCPAPAQQHAQAGSSTNVRRIAHLRRSSVSPATGTLYQRRDSWYEFLLKQFNPDDVDYGSWMEERREAFLDASVRNPYFRYSATVTVALIFAAMLYGKQRIVHRRSMWITAEMMTDLYNHDAYSRQVARDVIQKYNDHIECCNRAIEASEHGLSEGTDSDVDRFRFELQSVTSERDSYKRECDLAKSDLAAKERLLADMSLRLDALAKKSNGGRDTPKTPDIRNADQRLVQHINDLQEQLYAEKHENKRLKGA